MCTHHMRLLNSFLAEMGKRILKLTKWVSNSAVNVVMGWHTMKVRLLVRKLGFLLQLVSADGGMLGSETLRSMSDDIESCALLGNVESWRRLLGPTILIKSCMIEML